MTKTEGFYKINGYVYYGEYFAEDVLNESTMRFANPDRIKTNRPFKDNDMLVGFNQNHALTEPELANFKSGLDTLKKVLCSEKTVESDFPDNVEVPAEIKYLYGCLKNISELFEGKERFLKPNEIYIDNNNLVFYKSKRTPTGFSMERHTLMRYYKKEWSFYGYDTDFMQFVFQYISSNYIDKVCPYSSKAVLRGEIKSSFNTAEYLQKAFGDTMKFLKEYKNYGHYILYGENKSLIWYRSSGMYADMYIGSCDETAFHKIINSVPSEWKPQWKNDKT